MAAALAGRLEGEAPAEAIAALRDWAEARQAKALERIPRAWHRFRALRCRSRHATRRPGGVSG